jgi:hypothetical protein
MQAIEVETEIDENHEIHIRLPGEVRSGKARVVVLYDETDELPASAEPKPVRLGLFQGQAQLSGDFDAPLPDEFWLDGEP